MKKPLIGLLRIRNESLILKDTLDHMATFCNQIFVYDDASEDNSRKICEEHPAVTDIIRNERWSSNQTVVQGDQRSHLFAYATFKNMDANFIYMDADERIDFDWDSWDGESNVIMHLFDARMTPEDFQPFEKGEKLMDFRKFFGKEIREIPFIFDKNAFYTGVPCERHPQISEARPTIKAGFVQHYGKALSKKHWQDTCDYYAKNLPVYAEKWEARKKETGVVATVDDLLTWNQAKNLILKNQK